MLIVNKITENAVVWPTRPERICLFRDYMRASIALSATDDSAFSITFN